MSKIICHWCNRVLEHGDEYYDLDDYFCEDCIDDVLGNARFFVDEDDEEESE